MSTPWHRFSSAPHRMFFFFGIMALMAATGLWLADATVIYHGGRSMMAGGVSDLYAHGILMTLGVLPIFISGFLLTTFPRWMGQRPVSRTTYASAALLQAIGFAVLVAGLVMDERLVRLGLLVLGGGWTVFLFALVSVFWQAGNRPIHAWLVLPALITGDILVLSLAAKTHPLDGFWPLIPLAAVWWVLLPVFLSVAHRMIPFFSKNVVPNYVMRRPRNVLLLMILLIVLHPLLAAHPGLRVLIDAPLAICAAGLWLAWQPWDALRNRLLAVLHIGFAWLWIAALLFTIDDLLRYTGVSQMIWRAPLHALTMGMFGSLLLAMTTRVSLGHSGRPLRMSGWMWAMFWCVQLATAMRIVSGLPGVPPTPSAMLVAFSGILWLAAFLGWAVRFAPIYWQRRLDGAPG